MKKFGAVEAGLYKAILNMCVEPGKMCMNEMSSIDAKGGLGLAGIRNVLPLEYDKYARRGSTVFGSKKTPVASICTKANPEGADLDETPPAPVKTIPVRGAGLPQPGLSFQSSASQRPSNS